MGCASSSNQNQKKPKNANQEKSSKAKSATPNSAKPNNANQEKSPLTEVVTNIPDKQTGLTDSDIRDIRQCFAEAMKTKDAQGQELADFGTLVLKNILEEHPELNEYVNHFSGRPDDDNMKRSQVKAHIARMLNAIKLGIDYLHQSDIFVEICRNEGFHFFCIGCFIGGTAFAEAINYKAHDYESPIIELNAAIMKALEQRLGETFALRTNRIVQRALDTVATAFEQGLEEGNGLLQQYDPQGYRVATGRMPDASQKALGTTTNRTLGTATNNDVKICGVPCGDENFNYRTRGSSRTYHCPNLGFFVGLSSACSRREATVRSESATATTDDSA